MRRSTPGLALIAAALALSAPLAAQQEASAYGVEGGDQLTITFFTSAGEEIREIAGERTVGRDGNIFLPFLGTVRVEGMDAQVIRELLVERYAPYFENPVIDVEVRLRVSVTGAVGRPGNFFVDPTTTLVDLIAEAGGASEFAINTDRVIADASQVRLVRDGTTRIIDFRADSLDRDRALAPVESGDWLYVPFAQRSRFREEISFWGSIVGLITSVVILFNVT
ncbi:MAG: polysaccharide biosynthesis/export family protein [Longimicrobiales bacterium]|nr:polysaccharide biosynthesis/export family protein [Longimicrobiales bacterium]